MEKPAAGRATEKPAAGPPLEKPAAVDALDDAELLAALDIALVRAPNPGALTLTGTNTWLVGHDPAWVIDPGPRLDSHLERLEEAIVARGGLGGIALTHDHGDHSGVARTLARRRTVPLAAGRGAVDVLLADGRRFGPLEAVATPGHAPDHVALIGHSACFTGDAVLGEGSVFIAPYPDALKGYLQALERLRERRDIRVLCPGHGPLVRDPRAKLDEYISHRMDRERALRRALDEGRRSVAELLAAAWPDVPAALQAAAAVTLAAHLDKLEAEDVLPPGVERPHFDLEGA